jgi:hypothetical protein
MPVSAALHERRGFRLAEAHHLEEHTSAFYTAEELIPNLLLS